MFLHWQCAFFVHDGALGPPTCQDRREELRGLGVRITMRSEFVGEFRTEDPVVQNETSLGQAALCRDGLSELMGVHSFVEERCWCTYAVGICGCSTFGCCLQWYGYVSVALIPGFKSHYFASSIDCCLNPRRGGPAENDLGYGLRVAHTPVRFHIEGLQTKVRCFHILNPSTLH